MKNNEIDVCSGIQENAIALLGGQLTDEEEAAVMQHLAHCKTCREQFRRDRTLWMMLSGCPAPMAAPDFNEALELRIAQADAEIESADHRPENTRNTSPETGNSSRQIPPLNHHLPFPPNQGSIRRRGQI